MKKLLLIVFGALLLPVVVSAQVEVFPKSVDFGDISTGLLYLPQHTRVLELTNRSGSDIVVSSLPGFFVHGFDVALDVAFYGSEYGQVFSRNVSVAAGERVFIRLRLLRYVIGFEELPFAYRDTVFLAVRNAETGKVDSVGVPVRGEIVASAIPVVRAAEYDVFVGCQCDFTRGRQDQLGGRLDVHILNPVGAGYGLTIDSFSVELLTGGITSDWFTDYLQYDSAGQRIGRSFPRTLEPGRDGAIGFTVPYQLGEHRTIVRVFGHYEDEFQTAWSDEDTLLVLAREANTDLLMVVPSDPVFSIAPGVVVNDNYSFWMGKCSLADSVPLWVDTAYMTGPREPAIDLIKRAGGGEELVFPLFLECTESPGYNVKITTGRTFPGLTTDTITALYHYDDPERGRVDGVRKVTVQIFIDSVPLGVVREVRPVSFSSVEFSPNPSRDRVRVQYTGEGVATGISLYDMRGCSVYCEPVAFGVSSVAEVDVSGLPAGTYQAVIEGKSGAVLVTGSVTVLR